MGDKGSQEQVTTLQLILLATSILGGGAALFAIWEAIRRRYRATIGRRAANYRRLARLGTAAQLSFFETVLGEPPAMQATIRNDDFTELIGPEDPRFRPGEDDMGVQELKVPHEFLMSLFIDRDFYVQTICDSDRTVLAFSVTTRSNRFRPRYRLIRKPGLLQRIRLRRQFGYRYKPLVELRLGKTTFADLDPKDREEFNGPKVRCVLGAHNHHYSEITSFGNPGYYQWFAFSATDAARQGRLGDIAAASRDLENKRWPDPDRDADDEREWAKMKALRRFRRESAITTYTVVSGALWETNYPLQRFGPNENDVRTLP